MTPEIEDSLGRTEAAIELLIAERDRLRDRCDQMAGTLTLWLNLSPMHVRCLIPGANGKSLADLTREAFDE